MDAIKTAKVWIGERKGITSPIHVSQYDTAWTFQFKVYKDDLIYEPENTVSVVFTGKKSDDTVFAVPADFEDGVATVVSTVAMTSAAGIVECELRFSEGGETVGTANFDMVVEASPVEGGTPSEDDFTTLQTMVDAVAESAAAAEAAASTAAAELVAEVPDMIYDWLEANVTPETGYVIDNSLTVQGAAADAKATGDAIAAAGTTNAMLDFLTYDTVYREQVLPSTAGGFTLSRSGFLTSSGAAIAQNYDKYCRIPSPAESGRISVDGPLLLTLGLATYEWHSWSYSGTAWSSGTHSNTNKQWVSGLQPIRVTYESGDVSVCITFRRADGQNMDTTTDYAAIQQALKVWRVTDPALEAASVPADAAAVGTALYRGKNRALHTPAAFTWWEISDVYSSESPASPSNVPTNSYTYSSGARIAGFNNTVFSLTGTRNYFLFCWASLHNTPTRLYQIFSPGYDEFYVGRTNDSGATVEWSDWSPAHKKAPSIMFFGDSIVRGSTGSGQSANRIPDIVGEELNVRCENFGIGNIGWMNTGGTNKTNAIGYLQRVGNSTYYDSSDSWSGYKFLGSGDWSDFNTIVLSLGPNDGNYPLGDIQTDIINAGLDAKTYSEIMALTPTKIVVAMYQCIRYIRNISSTINIIISDPLISKGNSGVAPLWSYNLNIGTGGWNRQDLCDLHAEFCRRYGLGHITNYDAPIDRADITQSLADNVHPKSATYKALGLHFAGKIGALVL